MDARFIIGFIVILFGCDRNEVELHPHSDNYALFGHIPKYFEESLFISNFGLENGFDNRGTEQRQIVGSIKKTRFESIKYRVLYYSGDYSGSFDIALPRINL